MLTPNALLTAIVEDGHWPIDYASEYAEPGYTPGKRGILFANWNDETMQCSGETQETGQTIGHWYPISTFRSRVVTILEKAGFTCEWSDEWSTCECGKAIRTEADGWGWLPSFIIYQSGYTCRACWADCLSIDDRVDACRDAGHSIFAARRDSLPTDERSTA